MASGASRIQSCECAANVASGARRTRVFAGQRELGCVVIKFRTRPLCRGVAGFTGRGESGILMIRALGRLELRLVAIHTRGRGTRELAALMARSAFHVGVFSSKRKTRQTVIELCARPLRRGVARFALLREI